MLSAGHVDDFTIFADQLRCLSIYAVLNTLLRFEVEFNPETLIITLLIKLNRVATKTMHVAVSSSIPRSLITIWFGEVFGREVQKSQLFFALRMLVRGSRFTAWFRSGNLRSRKKNTGVLLPTSVPVTFSIEFQMQTTDITLPASAAPRSPATVKTCKQVGFLANFREQFRLGVFGNIVGHGKCTV